MGKVLGEEDKYTGHKKRNRSAADRLRMVTQKTFTKWAFRAFNLTLKGGVIIWETDYFSEATSTPCNSEIALWNAFLFFPTCQCAFCKCFQHNSASWLLFAFCFFYLSRRSNRSSNWLQIMYEPSMNVPTGSFRLAGQASLSLKIFIDVYYCLLRSSSCAATLLRGCRTSRI